MCKKPFAFVITYYKLTPLRIKKYWGIWWIGITIVSFWVTNLVISSFGEKFPVLGVAAFWALFLFFPLLNFTMEKIYSSLGEELGQVYSEPWEFKKWFSLMCNERLFVFNRNLWLWLTTLGVSSGIIGTLLIVGIPFQHPFLKISSFIVALIPVFCAGQGAYMILASMYMLWRMAEFELKPRYFHSVDSSPFFHLYSIYYTFSSLIIIGYGLTALLMWQSPIGFHRIFVWFLVVVSTFPLSLLILSTILIRRLQSKIQLKFMERINQLFEKSLRKLEKNPSKDNSEYVVNLLDLQSKVSKTRYFPINIESFLVFLPSVILPIVQFVLTLMGRWPAP
jgi:hypothetical protein